MKEIVVILENIRSAHNVGAILRTADGAGVKKIYLVGITPHSDHPKVKKTSLGAENFIETEYYTSTDQAIEYLRSQGFKIFSIEQSKDSKKLTKNTFTDFQKICVVFGNELTGISTETMLNSDSVIEIPMLGKKNSLNVSTTVGIILYNIHIE